MPGEPSDTGGGFAGTGVLSAQSFAPLFKDFHSSISTLTADVEHVKRTIAQNDEALRQEVEELDKDIEDETYERKDSFDRLRHEFETFAHRKAEKVVQELEEFTKEQAIQDGARARQLVDVAREVDRLKLHLSAVGLTWGRLVSSISDPTRKQHGGPVGGEGGDELGPLGSSQTPGRMVPYIGIPETPAAARGTGRLWDDTQTPSGGHHGLIV